MDPLIKNALEVTKKEGESFLRALYGEPVKEFSLLLKDKITARRYHNLIKTVVKAKRWLEQEGVTPQQVPLRILHPLLENSSLEENESLQEKWAALLTNAARPSAGSIVPAYVEILKQLSEGDAVLLEACYRTIVPRFSPTEDAPILNGAVAHELFIGYGGDLYELYRQTGLTGLRSHTDLVGASPRPTR